MDLLWIFFGAMVVFFGSFVGGYTGQMLFNYNHEKRIASLELKSVSALGVAAKQDKIARTQEAMAKAILIFKDEGIPKEEKMKHVMNLAAEYPDVAFELAKKIQKGGGLGGLI